MWHVITNKHSFFALLYILIGSFNIHFYIVYIGPYLTNKLGLEEQYLGYVLGISSLVYMITTLLLPYTCESLPRKLFFVVSFLGFTVTAFMLGPAD
jgi:predicted MFS family arabinose efflux permease